MRTELPTICDSVMPPARRTPSGIAAGAAAFLAFWALTIAFQFRSGAYTAEFSGYPDEPAHYVTGVMVDQYVRHGLPSPPVPFAENYYLHYPKVAIGHWPPILYVLQATWTLPFGTSRTSVLLLQSLLCAATAFLIFTSGRRFLGAQAALGAGALFIAVPLVRQCTGMVMAETLLTLTMFAAALALAAFAETGRMRDALGFAVLTSLALLTKGSGWALGLVVVIVIAITRRWGLFATKAMWVAAGVVLLTSLPWQIPTLSMASQGWESEPHYTGRAILQFGGMFVRICSLGILAPALVGIGSEIGAARSRQSPFWASMLGLIAAVWLFHSIVPAGIEERRVVMAVPAIILFAAAGCRWVVLKFVSARSASAFAAAAITALGLIAYVLRAQPSFKQSFGFKETARFVDQNAPAGSAVLISSDALGEGLLISELAMLENTPKVYVVRGSKLLAEVDWQGVDYRSRYQTAAEVKQALDAVPVSMVVVDSRANEQLHRRLVAEVLSATPAEWIRMSDAGRDGPIAVYRRADGFRSARQLRIDLTPMTGRRVELNHE